MRFSGVGTQGQIALSSGVRKTVLQLRSLGIDIDRYSKLIEFGISFDDTSISPVHVRLTRQSSNGTGTATAIRPFNVAATGAGLEAYRNFSVEPGLDYTILDFNVSTLNGLVFSQDCGIYIDSRPVGIDCFASTNINCTAYMILGEL